MKPWGFIEDNLCDVKWYFVNIILTLSYDSVNENLLIRDAEHII